MFKELTEITVHLYSIHFGRTEEVVAVPRAMAFVILLPVRALNVTTRLMEGISGCGLHTH